MVPLRVVDAFTDRAFSGNPAAVCLLDGPAPEEWMRAVAREMRHSETAFVHRENEGFRLRWFTPAKEVELCGHATLATAHVLWEDGVLGAGEAAVFETRGGRLTCRRGRDGAVAMDFPANPGEAAQAPGGLWDALGIAPCPVFRNHLDYLMVVTGAAAVRGVQPDFAALARLSDVHGFVVTAPGEGGVDYVCRYFVPAFGIDEDPVTGSIQTMLGPYWSGRLGRAELSMRQLSARGGAMRVRTEGARVVLTGRAVTVLRGEVQGPGREPELSVAHAASRPAGKP